MIELNKIYCESNLDTMARMPDGFLDCVITSPPYYGLRIYQTSPLIWGNHNGCEHVWGADLPYAKQDKRTPEQKAAQGATVGNSVNSIGFAVGNSGNFCQLCNAWRGELGLEPTFQLFISHLIDIFREVKRVLKPTGSVWVNLGDSYGTNSGAARQYQNGIDKQYGKIAHQDHGVGFVEKSKSLHKSLMNIPHRFAIAMTDELQFIQRNNINWWKRACMPSSAKDRFTVDFENIFFFVKQPKYWFEQRLEAQTTTPFEDRLVRHKAWDNDPLLERGKGENAVMKYNPNGRNMRTTWDIPFEPQSSEHYASYPTKLVERMARAGCPEGGIIYDPFMGTATTAVVAHKLGRQFIGSELNPKYVEIAERRLAPILAQQGLFQ